MDRQARNPVSKQLVLLEIVRLPDEMDMVNAHLVGDELIAAARRGAVVIADMTATVLCDSQGIRHLLLATDRAKEAGAELRLDIESQAVLRVLRITAVDRLLSIYPSLDAALTNAIPQ